MEDEHTQFRVISEPVLTIMQDKLWVNAACLNTFPDAWYVLFLLNREERKMIIKPAREEEQHVVRWKTPTGKPRRLSCADFLQDVGGLMNWETELRRKLYGRTARDDGSSYLAFDLNVPHTETFGEYRKKPLVKRLEEDVVATDG